MSSKTLRVALLRIAIVCQHARTYSQDKRGVLSLIHHGDEKNEACPSGLLAFIACELVQRLELLKQLYRSGTRLLEVFNV